MPSEKIILNELSKIIDPDFNRDIVSLGFIKNLSIKEGNVSFSIELTTPLHVHIVQFLKNKQLI